MQRTLLILATFAITDICASQASTTVATRKQFMDELAVTLTKTSASSAKRATPLPRTQSTSAPREAAISRVAIPAASRQPAAVRPVEGINRNVVRSTPKRIGAPAQPQETMQVDIATLLETLSSTISHETKTSITRYVASTIAREEKEKSVEGDATRAVSSTLKRTRALVDPQEGLKLEIATLLGALSSSISDETKTRIARYLASTIAREEKQKKELDDFTGKLNTVIQQLAQIKAIMNKQPIIYRTFRLSSARTCCGKEVELVIDLLNEVEAAIRSQEWGRHINFGGIQGVVRSSDHVNEEAIAGSWIEFLDARLQELESARSMQNDLEKSAKGKQTQTVLNNRVVQLRELCQLLRETALNKEIGADYREVVQELLNPHTASSEASTSQAAKKRRV